MYNILHLYLQIIFNSSKVNILNWIFIFYFKFANYLLVIIFNVYDFIKLILLTIGLDSRKMTKFLYTCKSISFLILINSSISPIYV